jgi:hypothetical protein
MMHRCLRAIFIASLTLLFTVSCGKPKPQASGSVPSVQAPAQASPSVTPEKLVPPAQAAPIKMPRFAMKTIATDDRPVKRASSTDPFLPTGSEAVRLPQDFVIGKIGDEGVGANAYHFAFDFLSSLARSEEVKRFYTDRGRQEAESIAPILAPLLPASVRVGSGSAEGEGGVSFLIRFVGKERSVTGELHLIRSSSAWLVDELILDEPVSDYGADGTARFDPFTYTRFL